jgi:hypothetical protein
MLQNQFQKILSAGKVVKIDCISLHFQETDMTKQLMQSILGFPE